MDTENRRDVLVPSGELNEVGGEVGERGYGGNWVVGAMGGFPPTYYISLIH